MNCYEQTEAVSVVPTMNGTRKSVCYNDLTLLDLLPEGTQKAVKSTAFFMLFVVPP